MTQGLPPPDSRRTRKKEALQLRIIDVAMQVFAEQGFEHATMEAIADEADIAKATLYRYFPVKEAILAGYWRLKAQEKTALVDKLLTRHKTTRKRLELFLETNLAEALQHGALFSAYLRFRMQHLQDDELDEQLRSGLHLHIQRLLAAGVKAGEIRTDLPLPILTAQFAMSSFLLFLAALRHPERVDGKKAIAGVVELYLCGAGNAH
jgi:AcrR family transcriptional regulator